ncbi:hypothetical protein [Lacticaseibacillus kribbianus]|uniref:hypothetical protein n=1 Tax=Lacticaseibacillus kribbianus TaxID=2926292 RepID=UPI001CD6FC56|nr:hypothetical protein [Lacticaseibacillus kribbianus]
MLQVTYHDNYKIVPVRGMNQLLFARILYAWRTLMVAYGAGWDKEDPAEAIARSLPDDERVGLSAATLGQDLAWPHQAPFSALFNSYNSHAATVTYPVPMPIGLWLASHFQLPTFSPDNPEQALSQDEIGAVVPVDYPTDDYTVPAKLLKWLKRHPLDVGPVFHYRSDEESTWQVEHYDRYTMITDIAAAFDELDPTALMAEGQQSDLVVMDTGRRALEGTRGARLHPDYGPAFRYQLVAKDGEKLAPHHGIADGFSLPAPGWLTDREYGEALRARLDAEFVPRPKPEKVIEPKKKKPETGFWAMFRHPD